MPFEGTLDEDGASFHGYKGSMGEFASDNGLQHDDRTLVSIEDILEFLKFVVENDLHEILPVFDQP
jgi:hypothetical protein